MLLCVLLSLRPFFRCFIHKSERRFVYFMLSMLPLLRVEQVEVQEVDEAPVAPMLSLYAEWTKLPRVVCFFFLGGSVTPSSTCRFVRSGQSFHELRASSFSRCFRCYVLPFALNFSFLYIKMTFNKQNIFML